MNFVPPTAPSHLNYVEEIEQQNMTPESMEQQSLDGCQNYTAAEAFVQGLASVVNQSDVETMIRAQKQMLQRFEKTNEMLLNCNALSQSRLKSANEDFKRHVKLLSEMKKDLDHIYHKIRLIKLKLNVQYPEAFTEATLLRQRSSLAEEAEDEAEINSSAVAVETTVSVEANPSTKGVDDKSKSATFVEAKEQEVSDAGKNKTTTVEYVQMDEAADNGKPIENELIKRVCSIETTNPNDSSDCTSEDTG